MAGVGGPPTPKFSSFKPKKSATPQSTSKRGNSGRSREPKLGRHRVEKPESQHGNSLPLRRRDGHRTAAIEDELRQSRSGRHRDHSSEREQRSSQPSYQYHFQTSKFSDTYTIDTRGDPANLHYRRPNKWTVPLYRLHGSGSILGLDPDIKIDKKLSDEHGYTLHYPKMRRAVKVIEAVEPDEMPIAAEDDVTGGEDEVGDADESEAHFVAGDGHQPEADFVALPYQESKAPSLPVITPKV